jgi:hypothetical protein
MWEWKFHPQDGLGFTDAMLTVIAKRLMRGCIVTILLTTVSILRYTPDEGDINLLCQFYSPCNEVRNS